MKIDLCMMTSASVGHTDSVQTPQINKIFISSLIIIIIRIHRLIGQHIVKPLRNCQLNLIWCLFRFHLMQTVRLFRRKEHHCDWVTFKQQKTTYKGIIFDCIWVKTFRLSYELWMECIRQFSLFYNVVGSQFKYYHMYGTYLFIVYRVMFWSHAHFNLFVVRTWCPSIKI